MPYKSKLSRKGQIFHLTINEHVFPEVPGRFSFLGYCHEHGSENGNPHTHIVVQFTDPISPRSLIDYIQGLYPEIGNIQVDPHSRLGTAIGYHLGLGNKPRCPNFIVAEPSSFDADKYIRERVAHVSR